MRNETSYAYINYNPSQLEQRQTLLCGNSMGQFFPHSAKISITIEKVDSFYNTFASVQVEGRSYLGYCSEEKLVLGLKKVEHQILSQVGFTRKYFTQGTLLSSPMAG